MRAESWLIGLGCLQFAHDHFAVAGLRHDVNSGRPLCLSPSIKISYRKTPFEIGLVVAEVYPSLWSRNFAREERNGDQHDAYSAAAWMRGADLDGSLAAFLNPSLATPERAVAQVEGWILGVA